MISQSERSRFVDRGGWLAAFATSVIGVCPNCGGPALVMSQTKHTVPFQPIDGRVTCTKCAFHLKQVEGRWLGPASQIANDDCGKCGYVGIGRLADTASRRDSSKQTFLIVCPSCGHVSSHGSVWWIAGMKPLPIDPIFGLPLWLQEPCCGHTLWAYNGEHLVKLRQYVSASLREKASTFHPMEESMFANLPQWLIAAKNREAVLTSLTRLESKLDVAPKA